MSAPISLEVAVLSPSTRTDDALAVDVVDGARAARPTTTAPESRAVMYSMPVPT
jgi:hypothetical protein